MKNFISLLLFFVSLSLQAQLNVDFSMSPDSGCAPINIVFSNLSSNTGSVKYIWDFGNGAPPVESNDPVRQIVYDKGGKYSIKLTVMGNGSQKSLTKTLVIFNPPEALFKQTIKSCVPTDVVFDNTSSRGDAPIAEFKWNFGDGKNVFGSSQTKSYIAPASYDVFFKVTDSNGCSDEIVKQLQVFSQPTNSFSLDKDYSCTAPLTVKATLTGLIVPGIEYNWDFGDDNNIKTTNPPTYTFNSTRLYSIKLTAQAGENCKTVIEKNVMVGHFATSFEIYYGSSSLPIANKQAIPKGILNFKNTSDGNRQFKWLINGKETINKDAVDTFCTTGTYSATLIAGTDLPCPDTIVKTFTIIDLNGSSITLTQDRGEVLGNACTGTFNFTSPFNMATNEWNFISTKKNGQYVSYVNCDTGTFTVTLKSAYSPTCIMNLSRDIVVKDCNGANINIRNEGVVYDKTNPVVCTGDNTFFMNSQITNTSVWTIDGINYNETTPKIKICKEGSHTASLNGSYISGCAINTSKTFTVKKCVTDNFKMSDITQKIILKPNDTVCFGNTIQLEPQNPSQFVKWLSVVEDRSPLYFYKSTEGKNNIGMVSTLKNGCTDTVYNPLNAVRVIADFEFANSTMDCPFPIITDFVNKSKNANWYKWSSEIYSKKNTFIQNNFSTQKSPLNINFSAPYQEKDSLRHWVDTSYVKITLLAENKYGCTDTAVKKMTKQMPLAAFIPEKSWGCVDEDYVFESLEEPGYDFIDSLMIFNPDSGKAVKTGVYRFNEINRIRWEFGDGAVTTIDASELDKLVTNMNTCFNPIGLGAYDKKIFDKCTREQTGYGKLYCIYRYLKITRPEELSSKDSPSLYDAFMNCWNNAKKTSGRTVSHKYPAPGEYMVRQIVEDKNGCIDTSYQVKVRVGKKLDVNFSLNPSTICPGDSITLTGTGSDAATAQTWHYYSQGAHLQTKCSGSKDAIWKANPLTTGSFDILLRASYNGCNTEILKKNIVTVKGPVGQFSHAINCDTPYTYKFTGLISDAAEWQWDFGDTIIKNVSNPVYEYKKTGNYSVTLTSKNPSSGCKDYVYTKSIFARKLKAVVDHDSTYCPLLGLTLNAHNSVDYISKNKATRSGDVEPFVWLFNGLSYRRSWDDTVNYVNYSKSKVSVTLIALDTNHCSDTLTFDIIPRFPNSSFTADKKIMCGPTDSITFNYTGLDSTITQWRWSFGDGKWDVEDTSTMVTKLKHTFNIQNDKRFQVLFQVDDNKGCFDIDTITVDGYFQPANFKLNSHSLCMNDIAKFTNISSQLDSSKWNFGDGITLSTTFDTVEHFYSVDNKYQVVHTGYYKQCKDVFTDTVVRAYPDARFTVNQPVVCTGKEIIFSLIKPLPYAQGTWRFPESNPFNYIDGKEYYSFYEAGEKTIYLTLNFGSCTDSSSLDMVVNGSVLAVENPRACVGNEIRFYNNIGNIADSLYWDFGDGTDTITKDSSVTHKYLNRKSYSVELISYKTGCNDTAYARNIVKIQAVDARFNVSDSNVCLYDDVVFTQPNILDAIHGSWHFDSLNIAQYAPNDTMTKPYTKLGKIKAWLVVQSQNNCVDTAYRNINVNGALASIIIPPNACKGQEISFKKDSLLNVKTFTWFFGDGDVSQLDSPIHKFYKTGSLYTQLKIQDSTGCSRFISKPLNIIDIAANLLISKDTICTGDAVQLVNASKLAKHCELGFEDGSNATIIDTVNKIINDKGTHQITMLATSAEGCTDVDTVTLNVYTHPAISLTAKDSICTGEEITLSATHDTIASSQWFINSYPYIRNRDTITDSPLQSVRYGMMVTDTIGCSSLAEKNIFVQQHAEVSFPLTDTTITIGDTIIPRVASNVQSTFEWRSISKDMSCTNCSSPKIYSFSSNDYMLYVKNWCFVDSFLLHINVIPGTNFGVPTAFTPNSDGHNDLMIVRGWGIKRLIEFSIYNRWGQKIFSTNDINKGWDGTFNGKQQPQETYAYMIEVETYLEPSVKKQGYFTLFR